MVDGSLPGATLCHQMTEDQFKTLVRELRIIQISIAVMIVILVFIAGWLQP
jgi:hypothetical protein